MFVSICRRSCGWRSGRGERRSVRELHCFGLWRCGSSFNLRVQFKRYVWTRRQWTTYGGWWGRNSHFYGGSLFGNAWIWNRTAWSVWYGIVRWTNGGSWHFAWISGANSRIFFDGAFCLVFAYARCKRRVSSSCVFKILRSWLGGSWCRWWTRVGRSVLILWLFDWANR